MGNSGYRNSGDWNSGDWNSGYRNSGNWNSGYINSGNWNSGYCNSGDRNSGYCNSGDSNSGNWNSGNCNSGNCNSITPSEILVFNKMCSREVWDNAKKPNWMHVNLTEWVHESNMSDKEKESYPSYVTTGGYLKVYSSLKEAYVESWEKASEKDKKLTFKLPNFDIDVFKEVFGFTPVIDDKVDVVCEGKTVRISRESAIELGLLKQP